jgi:hypothetical protein
MNGDGDDENPDEDDDDFLRWMIMTKAMPASRMDKKIVNSVTHIGASIFDVFSWLRFLNKCTVM